MKRLGSTGYLTAMLVPSEPAVAVGGAITGKTGIAVAVAVEVAVLVDVAVGVGVPVAVEVGVGVFVGVAVGVGVGVDVGVCVGVAVGTVTTSWDSDSCLVFDAVIRTTTASSVLCTPRL